MAAALHLVAQTERPLAVDDRFELTFEAGPKLRPKASRTGRIIGEGHDNHGAFWKVRFDGTTNVRFIDKSYIQAERRR